MTNVRGDTNPEHNRGTDAGAKNYERTAQLMDPDVLPYCNYCKELRYLIHMPGDGWALNHIHEQGCPHHDDHTEPYAVHIGGGYDAGTHLTAEAVWQASEDYT